MCSRRHLRIHRHGRVRGLVNVSHFWAKGGLETIAGLLRRERRREGYLSLPCSR